MSDQIAKGLEFEKKAEKKLSGWGLFGSKYEDAGDLFEKAANCYKLAKSWDQAGAVYVKLAQCHLKASGDSKHEAASAYADAGHAYKKTNTKGVHCLPRAIIKFVHGKWEAQHVCKILQGPASIVIVTRFCGLVDVKMFRVLEIAELYEQEQNLEQAIAYYDKAADLFQGEEVTTSANQCKQKIAQFSAQLEQYQKAIEIFEEVARQSLNSNLLKYGVRGHLLNAGICQLCKGDVVAITNALERYQELDPTFSGTREYRLLADLAAALDEEDVVKFTDAVKEFDSMTKLDEWKTTLLLRVKLLLKAKEDEEDDLT
ncbi:alpha-soluble NSF attachment protein-like protein [Tanacetum coccineum]|uniref:Alpha-soluble NSF attachment protein-like protein n=1 Tax=Tanacetum coccineum TaxID=301880 RepID=A0ABQ5ARZ6_9ASTR